ncbi:MAG TPA: hypothetical protein VNS58_19140 [Puia sp.]|nr:hypothetical protein [Puia sp.]
MKTVDLIYPERSALIERSYAMTNHLFVKDALEDYADTHAGKAPCLLLKIRSLHFWNQPAE